MSLKFGIFLVEQRIISPEQFCGLVKIQQDASPSIATIALRRNMLTIKQVAEILDIAEATPEKSFVRIAMEMDLLDRADADQLLHEQQLHCPEIRKLIVECGLLTQRQASVLSLHYERSGAKPVSFNSRPKKKTPPAPKRVAKPAAAPVVAQAEPAVEQGTPQKPRQPKFRQRPVIVRQYTQG